MELLIYAGVAVACIVAAAFVVSKAKGAKPLQDASTPRSKANPDWINRVELIKQRIVESERKAQVIFLGDSITQQWEANGSREWADFEQAWGSLNMGVNGDSTQHLLWRVINGNIDLLDPCAAVLLIGSNNIKMGHSENEIISGVKAVIAEIQRRLPNTKILLLSILPRNDQPPGRIQKTNAALNALSDGRQIFWLDCNREMAELDGSAIQSFVHDKVHLTPAGYSKLSSCIRPVLERLCPLR